MTATEQKIKQAREKSREWIEYLATKSDKELEKRLRINHQQYALAEKEKQGDMCELLGIMERILIEARIYKAENKIEDIASEIELALAEMEMQESKAEERVELMEEFNSAPVRKVRREQAKETDENQLTLF